MLFFCLGAWIAGTADAEQPTTRPAQVIRLDSPTDYQVFQRLGEKGPISIRGHENEEDPLEYRLSGTGLAGAWQPLEVDTATQTFELEAAALAGGWYQLEIRAAGQTQAAVTIEHVGVGEVLVVGGQSNSTNWGEKKQQTQTALVSSFDGKRWGLAIDPLPGVDGRLGSIWPIVGDALVDKYHVPVGIVPVGQGSTSVRQWLPAGQRVQIQTATTRYMEHVGPVEWECNGFLFNRMVSRMKSLGPFGFRAMLWHQGESDANQKNGRSLPGDTYRQYLKQVITESRKQVGWDVPWFVAQVSYGSPQIPSAPDIRAAQKSLWDDGTAMAGPDTDTLSGDNRGKNGLGVHFSEKGMHAHAAMWVNLLQTYIDASQAKVPRY
jgi:hypothetical protein